MDLLRKFKNLLYLCFKKVSNDLNLIGRQVVIGDNVFLKGAVLSGNIQIGDNSKIFHANLNGNIIVGKNTSIWGPNIVLVSNIHKITIGNYCSIARNVIFQEYNHDMSKFTTYYINKNILGNNISDVVSKGEITIGHDVWIGANAVVLTGAKIGTGAVIGANSVVTGEIPPYAIVGGVPGKVLKYRFPLDVQNKLLDHEWWEWDKQEIIVRIPELAGIVNNTD